MIEIKNVNIHIISYNSHVLLACITISILIYLTAVLVRLIETKEKNITAICEEPQPGD